MFCHSKKIIIRLFISLILCALCACSHQNKKQQEKTGRPNYFIPFPLDHYSQNINTWINPNDPNYDQPLVSEAFQQQRLQQYYDNQFGERSIWNPHYIVEQLREGIPLVGREYIQNSQLVGANFKPYTQTWIDRLITNENLSQFKHPLFYHAVQRGIAITNLNVRLVATDEPLYYLFNSNGKKQVLGDLLQVSSLWIGTPIYIVGHSKDGLWSLVITSSYAAWVKSSGIATVDDLFIHQWQTNAQQKLAAITTTATPIDDINNNAHEIAYVGSTFPVTQTSNQNIQILFPQRTQNGNAVIDHATLSPKNAVIMPLLATPHHFANIIATLIGKPYHWGGKDFFNDCSQELQSLFTPFAFWLPRNSADQVYMGKVINLSAASVRERLYYLTDKGHPFMTIIYIGGHIVLYIGNFPNPNSAQHEPIAMTFQDLSRLKSMNDDQSAIVMKSVFFPLLKDYPELPEMRSLANEKYFILSFLDEMPHKTLKKLTPAHKYKQY